jgi:pimeloyl-ACP methyl ester carboxylesterase
VATRNASLDSLFTRASAAIDKGVARFMERRMASRTPAIDITDARQRMIDIAAHYSNATLGAPSRFFPEPAIPRVELGPVSEGPLGTHVVDLQFRSEYEPFHPLARAVYAATPENHTVHARWWTSGKGRPAIVMLHGWGGGQHWLTSRQFEVPYWLRHGFDVAAYVLPHHGARAVGAGGLLFPSPNPLRTNEGFGQAIYEVRALAMFLRSRGASALGTIGMSLGGYTAALWASIAGPHDAGGLDFCVALVPAVSFSQLMWQHGEYSDRRAHAVKAGITEELLAGAFMVHAPTTRPARLSRDRLAVIAGRGDRICPPEQAEMLAKHWGVEIQWFGGGHLTQVGRGETLRTVRRQIGALGFTGREMRL